MNSNLSRRSGLIVAALSLALLFGAGVFLNSGSSAKASDSETAALIGDFNQYRESHGVPALSTSGSADADAQAAADRSAANCGYYLPSGHGVAWETYAYGDSAQVWSAYQGDPHPVLDYIGNPNYQSAGVGRVASTNCSFGPIWVIVLDASGGPVTTPPPTSPPTPTNAPMPTSSSTPTPTPTPAPTSLPSGSHTPTSSVSPTPTDIPLCDVIPPATRPAGCVGTPTPTHRPAPMPGDVDCGGTINMKDVILLLETAAHVPVFAPCLGLTGIDCTGGVDATDALVLLEFLENIPYHLPDGCPPPGPATPSPTPLPTLEPSKTPTPTPGVPPIPAGINHCELAMVAYQMDAAESLNGEESCAPGAGTAYDCVFSTDDHKAVCVSSSSDFPDYTCSLSAGFADCIPSSGSPEYQCFGNSGDLVSCIPAHTGYAWYDCAVNGSDVTCISAAPAPNFDCRREGAQFNCLALASATPTAPPG